MQLHATCSLRSVDSMAEALDLGTSLLRRVFEYYCCHRFKILIEHKSFVGVMHLACVNGFKKLENQCKFRHSENYKKKCGVNFPIRIQ